MKQGNSKPSFELIDFAAQDLEAAKILLRNRYYIPTRYPEAILAILPDGRLPNENDAQESYQMAEDIFNFVKERLSET